MCGLLPAQRRPIARQLLAAAPHDRVQMLPLLNFYLATVVQEVSALREAASRRATVGPHATRPVDASSTTRPPADRDHAPARAEAEGDDEDVAEDHDPDDADDDVSQDEEAPEADPLAEESADDEEDDNFMSMQLATLRPRDRRDSSGLTFALALEGLSAALMELPVPARFLLAQHLYRSALLHAQDAEKGFG